jgi:hypothetical protein
MLSNIENFNRAFEEREFNKAYSYIFDMVSQVWIVLLSEASFLISFYRQTNILQKMNHGKWPRILKRKNV